MALATVDRPELREEEPEDIPGTRRPRLGADKAILAGLIAVVVLVQGWNIADYPTVSDDEGTYLAQAWAIQHGHGLAPYTYWYDHPPGGWIQLAMLTWIPALASLVWVHGPTAAVILLPQFLFFVASTIVAGLFPCPRCGQSFATLNWWALVPLESNGHCKHCRIQQGSPKASTVRP